MAQVEHFTRGPRTSCHTLGSCCSPPLWPRRRWPPRRRRSASGTRWCRPTAPRTRTASRPVPLPRRAPRSWPPCVECCPACGWRADSPAPPTRSAPSASPCASAASHRPVGGGRPGAAGSSLAPRRLPRARGSGEGAGPPTSTTSVLGHHQQSLFIQQLVLLIEKADHGEHLVVHLLQGNPDQRGLELVR